jgi:phosphatidate phosphatase APP1
LFEQRVNQFLVDNERGKWFTLQLRTTKNAASKSLFRVGNTDVNGHVLEQLSINSSIVEDVLSPALTSINYCTSVNAIEVCGRARLIPQQGLSVISDIDDTVKISEVRSKKALIENTFVHPFKAVPSIAQKYSAWAEQGVSFHYVSSSPWYLYTELTSFLEQSGFPDFSLSLKSFRFRDESLLALFKDGEETKPRQIRQVIEKYPRRQFVLIGDSGEQDPEVYTAIKLEYPNQIMAIYIRDLGSGDTNKTRTHDLVERMDGFPIVLFKDASELPATLSAKQ